MKNIDLISVPVNDQERAKHFYVQQLGFQIITETAMGPEQKWIQLGLENGQTSIALVNWFSNMPAGCLQGLIILSENIEKDRQQLLGNGVTVAEIENTPWGKFAGFKDPDGNGWSLHQKK